MELIERDEYLIQLQKQFEKTQAGEGHCIFVSGEAGIGKTTLIKAFCKELTKESRIYHGTCDALFTPRPLAPLYDIAMQFPVDLQPHNWDIADRTGLFSLFFHELRFQKETCVIVFEDIHWADEATLDFIKFLARRISQLKCLFILTYRDYEIHTRHPLRNVLGQLNPDSFIRIQLMPLSRQAVERLAAEKGYNGEDVYSITGGNPFYVSEILASYSQGVPDNIKDSILSVYNRLDEKTKQVWEILSVSPTGFRIEYLEKMEPLYAAVIERGLELKILILEQDRLFFKHELYRRTIEVSLSPFVRVALNKKILDLLKDSFVQNHEIEQIIHHAKNANEYDLVVQYAPAAARLAVLAGAHIEASRLYLSAIEYYQGHDQDILIELYESYAYECYLTNQIKEAIIYTGKSLTLWNKKNEKEKIGNCMRFLSRLWWFDGNRKKAESYGAQAIEVLDTQPSSRARAMAYSNMSQLMMLSDQPEECIFWGEKAIAMAKELSDDEILCHALNNVGDVQIRIESSKEQGILLLQQSLEIALKNSYHEHVARAYTNLGHNGLLIKNYDFARKYLDEGIQYCEERNLDSWTTYMLSSRARLYLDTGNWNEAYRIADNLNKNADQSGVVKIGVLLILATVKMRRAEDGALAFLLEAKAKALETMELQRIIPAVVALLEYEWLTGQSIIEQETLGRTITMIEKMGNVYENSLFAFWMQQVRKQKIPLREEYAAYDLHNEVTAREAAVFWQKSGCPYEQALALFEGNEDDKRKAITLVQQLGADAVFEKLKSEMRNSGIKSIPRGIRKTTRSNAALLTSRELEILQLIKESLQNKEIAAKLFISAKTVDHHISSILFKLDVNTRVKAVNEALRRKLIK